MEVTEYVSSNLNRGGIVPYSRDYVGGVQLIQQSGFQPFAKKQPLNSTLNQVFEEFRSKTGFDVDSESLKDEFLDRYPRTRNALNLYDALESTFSSDELGKPAAIVEFLDSKIDEYVSDSDADLSGDVSLSESGMNSQHFERLDANRDSVLNGDEIKSDFYNGFKSLNNILGYFKANPGSLLDTYA